MAYFIRCIMPHERCLCVKDKVCLPCDEQPFKTKEQTILYVDQQGCRSFLSFEEVGNRFFFEYVNRIVFLHEKDLRRCVYECIERNDQSNDWLEFTRKKLLAHETHSGISLRHVGVIEGIDIGHGIFTEQHIEAGSYIGEYCGLVSSVCETISRESHYNFQYPSCDGGLDINAREIGNMTRFINHSTTPNASFKAVCLEDIMHVVCITSEDLPPNTQITVDYGAAFWVRRNFPPVTPSEIIS